MAMTQLPPAGWFADPDDSSLERYWSGSEWTEQRRAKPSVASSPSPSPTAQPSGSPSALTKLRHVFGGWPLDEVVAGLHAPDTTTRVDAASRLWRVKRRDKEQRLQVEIACLTDPVPAVRSHALRALVAHEEGRTWLLALLISDQDADASMRAWVLADLAGIDAPDSPYHGKTAKVVKYNVTVGAAPVGKNIVHEAIDAAGSAVVALPILEAAARAGLSPVVHTPWTHEVDFSSTNFTMKPSIRSGRWPDRCCVCGAPHPIASEELAFSGVENVTQVGNVRTTTTVKGTLNVPVCGRPECHPPKPTASPSGLAMKFPSPQFVAELLYHDTWFVS